MSAAERRARVGRRPVWRRLVGFNLLTGVLLGVGGFYLGWFGGHWLVNGLDIKSLDYVGDTDQNDVSLFLGYILGVIGFLIGLGFAVYPFARLRGYPPSLREKETSGLSRYFGLSTDHKVIGMQYFIGIGFFFFVAGVNAMLIRFELLRPAAERLAGRELPDARHRARDDDDGDDDERDPRPVRQLPAAADDRGSPNGVSADRGTHLLAAHGGRIHPDQRDRIRRRPDGLDRLRAAQPPGEHGHGRLHHVLRARRALDDARRAEHARDSDHDARPRNDVEAAADLRLGRDLDRRS